MFWALSLPGIAGLLAGFWPGLVPRRWAVLGRFAAFAAQVFPQ